MNRNAEKNGLIGFFSSISILYELFQKMLGGDQTRKKFVREYLVLDSNDKILDYGCGTAKISQLLGKVDYYAYEPQFKYHQKIKKNTNNSEVTFFWVEKIELHDEYNHLFDCIILSGVLHHLHANHIEELLKILKNKLRPGGTIVTIDPVIKQPMGLLNKLVNKLDRGNSIMYDKDFEKKITSCLGNVNFFYDDNMGFSFSFWQCISIYVKNNYD